VCDNSLKTTGLEKSLAGIIPPILTALSAFFLSVMLQMQQPGNSPDRNPANGLVCILGLFSLLTAALIIDGLLDKEELDWRKRCDLVKGGYVLFCFVVSALNLSTLVLYSMGEKGLTQIFEVPWLQIVAFVASSICVVWKMMSQDKKNCSLLFLTIF